MRRGASLHSTMAAGRTLARAGDGYLGRMDIVRGTPQRWLDGLADRDGVLGLVGVSVLASDSGLAMVGVRWASGSRSTRCMGRVAVTIATSTSATRASR